MSEELKIKNAEEKMSRDRPQERGGAGMIGAPLRTGRIGGIGKRERTLLKI